MEDINQSVKSVCFKELKAMKGFDTCVEEYRTLCLINGVKAIHADETQWYDDSKDLVILAVTHGDECVGFCGMFKTYYPHINENIMVVESLFIRSSYTGRYWFRLFSAMRAMTSRNECKGMILDAPVNSRFNKLLSLKCKPLNTSYWCNVK